MCGQFLSLAHAYGLLARDCRSKHGTTIEVPRTPDPAYPAYPQFYSHVIRMYPAWKPLVCVGNPLRNSHFTPGPHTWLLSPLPPLCSALAGRHTAYGCEFCGFGVSGVSGLSDGFDGCLRSAHSLFLLGVGLEIGYRDIPERETGRQWTRM